MNDRDLTARIVLAMFVGTIFGVILRFLPTNLALEASFITNVLSLGGNAFISLMKLLVVPIVLVSIVCGVCSLEKINTIGSMGFKSLKWFVVTTFLAVLLALVVAHVFHIGANLHLTASKNLNSVSISSLWMLLNDIVPSNIFKAMADTNMLQVIVFSLLLGIAINVAGEAGRRVAFFFVDLNVVLMKFITLLMRFSPYGVFCLVTVLFVNQGFDMILGILNYFLAVLAVLFMHTAFTYSIILHTNGFSPRIFFRKFYPVMLFAFGISSSNAAIPAMLNTVVYKFGVSHAIASFVVPLGVNMNKNGTAIMQGIAAVFFSHAYHIDNGILGDFVLLLMIVLGSIGTAGVPGVGIITLTMILEQLGIPTEGIGMIIGVDRLLDMTRTAVNVTGNAMTACLVAKAEDQIDYKTFRTPE